MNLYAKTNIITALGSGCGSVGRVVFSKQFLLISCFSNCAIPGFFFLYFRLLETAVFLNKLGQFMHSLLLSFQYSWLSIKFTDDWIQTVHLCVEIFIYFMY